MYAVINGCKAGPLDKAKLLLKNKGVWSNRSEHFR